MSSYNWSEDRYSYDSLNRLKSVAEYRGAASTGYAPQDYAQVYDYDRWGNRIINQTLTWGTGAPKPNFGVDTTSNRLTAPAGYSISYDNAGNQTNDNYTGQGARTYDAENRLKQAWANNQWQTYTYDADGRRIKRNVNGVETWQLYGMDGELLAEYAAGAAPFLPATEYGYRNGELLTTIQSGDTQRLSRFVTNLYYGARQRDPSAQELQDGINQLAAAGALSQSQLLTVASQIARSLFTSTSYETSPYRSDTQYVADLYYAYLQRAPDDGGLGFWAGQAASSRVNVCNAFEASGEFQTLVATLYGTAASDNERTEHFVNNFYLGAYGRNATSTELQQQRDALNTAAAQGSSQVQAQAETFGRSLFAGQVNDASLSNTQYVTNLYEAFLQRGPDAGGLSWWAGQASVGTGRQNVLNAFATCGAFRELSGTLYREANWLVADQLGTPRMIVNKSGTLASVKRHDYMPFGEELFAGTGGRTNAQGYMGDTTRQKFTGYEHDGESGLDFAQARYYSSAQGRFTGVDRLVGSLVSPQSLNRYSYVSNTPLTSTDPSGLFQVQWPGSNNAGSPSSGEGERAEDDYDQRFQNTCAAIAANAAQARGDLNTRDRIMAGNSTLEFAGSGSSNAEVKVSGIELLAEWGKDPSSPAVGKGSVDAFDYSDNPSRFILDVQQGDVDPNSIFTVAVTFKGLNTDGWVPDSAKASAPTGGRWSLVETPTGLAPIRTRESGDLITVLLNVRGADLKTTANKPLSVQVSAYYHSLYRQDQRAGIERGSITQRISLKLLIGETSSTVRPVP